MNDIKEQSLKFDEIYNDYKSKKNKLFLINKEKYALEKELKILNFNLQKCCNHNFVREETTSGCYREFHDICTICGLWK